MKDSEEIRSIEIQLENKREHLLLIQERKSQYVLDTDVPLVLIKEERETVNEIADLEARLNALRLRVPVRSTTPSTQFKKPVVWFVGCAVFLLLVVVLSIASLSRLLMPNKLLPSPTSVPVAASDNEVNSGGKQTPQPGSNQTSSINSTPKPDAGLVFAPPTFTSTPTQPGSVNLTNNREGGYSTLRLLYDPQANLHMVFYSRILRASPGDYFHMQMSPEGVWSTPERLTDDFEILWSDLDLILHPDGYVCILFAGIRSREEAYYRRCQNGPNGSFSYAEVWQPHEFDTRAGFSAIFMPDGSILPVFGRVGGGIYVKGQTLSDDLASAISPHLTRDKGGLYHLAWFRAGEPYSLEYRSSTDAGETWSDPARLTTEEDIPDEWFDFVADGVGNVHLVWPAFNDGIFYRRWTQAGGWGDAVKIMGRNCLVKLAANPAGLARVVAGCWDGLLFFEQTTDGTWLPPYQISDFGADLWGLGIVVDQKDRETILWIGNKDIYQTNIQAGTSP